MLQAEIDALKRACRYSFPPNRLGYCGPRYGQQAFHAFFSSPSPENAEQAKQALQKFDALYPYLELIAKENGKHPFDQEVIEAYWLGNGLLENVRYRALQKTILSFQKHGLPKSVSEQKASQLPEEMLAHHSMHVLYVNFISGKVKPLVKNLSNCLVQWAQVVGETPKGTRAKGIELFLENNELKLRESQKTLQNPFFLGFKPGSAITIHWGSAVEEISEQRLKNLKRYTIKNLKAVNSG